MTESETDTETGPQTAEDRREAARGANKTVALILVGISVLFLMGALGTGMLVLYGPY